MNPESISISIEGELVLHRNLSYEAYFASYNREIDGTLHIATYSFNKNAFSSLNRLMPFSRFYIAENHIENAKQFIKRFPLYLVYSVPRLHTKCVYFEKSRRLLFGSQNLFSSTSSFEELTCEIRVLEKDVETVSKIAIDFPAATYLRVQYDETEIKAYVDGCGTRGVAGRPYLPCHKEREYWRQWGEFDGLVDKPDLRYIYIVLEYETDDGAAFLAFDRLYCFCGEITKNAFFHLRKNFANRRQDYVFLDKGEELKTSAPFKDRFAFFHPIAGTKKAHCMYVFDP